MKYNLVCYQSDNKENPGFFASQPLRGASRQREDDFLIIHLMPAQNTAFWDSRLAKLTREAAVAFYRSPGSITSAMRDAIECVNKALRVQNSGLRLDQSPESAAMMVGVLRDGALYLAQVAHASALLVSGAGTRLFFDGDIEQRGLGLSDLLELRYYRGDFFGEDYLLMGAPSSLTAIESEAPTPKSVIRLVNEIADLPSAYSLTKISLGEGKVENRLLSLAMLLDEAEPPTDSQTGAQIRPAEELADELSPDEVTEADTDLADVVEEKQFDFQEPDAFLVEEDGEPGVEIIEEPVIIDIPQEESGSDTFEFTDTDLVTDTDLAISDFPVQASDITTDQHFDEPVDFQADISGTFQADTFEEDREFIFVHEPEPVDDDIEDEFFSDEPPAPPQPDLEAIARQERLEKLKKGALTGVARSAGWLRGIEMNAQSFARRTEQKVSASGQEIPSLSPFAKWAIVIIVPLLVVAITVSIYFARGLDRQYVYYINQAHAQIQAAKSSATQGEQRQALVQAVVWLNQAREFNQGDTEEIIKMRNEAQGQLDKMDNVRRLMLSNAFGNIVHPDLYITHLVPGRNAVFALNANTGNILRFYQAGDTYLLDTKFACGPVTIGDVEMGKIIDITDVQGSSPNSANVLGIDAMGNIVLCSDGGQEQIATSLTQPEGGFGSIDAIHYGNDGLYIMDVSQNKIWVYRGLGEAFPYEPGLYLDASDADLTSAIDITVRREGLFVLYADGRTVFSNVPSFSGFVEAQAPNVPWQVAQGNFSQISGLQVADNVLYFLEPGEPSISRYSYRLVPTDVLKVSFGDQATPRQNATAMTVSSSQVVFIAFGSELYFAQLP